MTSPARPGAAAPTGARQPDPLAPAETREPAAAQRRQPDPLGGRRRPARGTGDRAPEERGGDSGAREPAGAERTQSSTDHRTRPRRRGAALESAIFEAVLAELAEAGYARLSVERVAERAGASKASLYRRWPGKTELVMDAVYSVLPDPQAPPDTGSLRGDLLALFRAVARQLAGPAGQGLRGLLSDVLRDEGRAAQVREYARGTSQRMVQEVVRRAGERGEVDPAAVTPRRLEAGHAQLRYHFLVHGAPIPDEVIVGIVDEVVVPLLRLPAP